MAFVFKKQIFGFMDLLRFKKMVKIRREKFALAPAIPIPATYKVNETAKILHPGYFKGKLVQIDLETPDTKTYTFETSVPFYFRAGQYATLGCKVGESLVSRPYAISSSPEQALSKKVSFTVKKCGFFSDYLFDEAKVGDVFTIGDPSGEFCYEPLKDSKNILAIAGGSGITPFYSMAQAIKDGTINCNLTVLYGARTEKDLILREKFEALLSDKCRIVYVLSDEKKAGYENGFIGADIIRRYAPDDFTVMMCGPQAMYDFVNKELSSFDLPAKRVKREANCVGVRDVADAEYQITVHIGFNTYKIKASAKETVLTAMERAGLNAPAKCRAGGCGFCHSKLVSGKFSLAGADKRRLADKKFGYLHPCCSYPDSDMEIIVPKA